MFHKRECQEKYSPVELEAGEGSLTFSPCDCGVCGVGVPIRKASRTVVTARTAGFHVLPFPLVRMCSSERPGEDRSATIGQEEKEIVAPSVPETQQAVGV